MYKNVKKISRRFISCIFSYSITVFSVWIFRFNYNLLPRLAHTDCCDILTISHTYTLLLCASTAKKKCFFIRIILPHIIHAVVIISINHKTPLHKNNEIFCTFFARVAMLCCFVYARDGKRCTNAAYETFKVKNVRSLK